MPPVMVASRSSGDLVANLTTSSVNLEGTFFL